MPSHSVYVRVWDLPTRVFHWLLFASVVGSIVSAKIGGNAIVWHMRFGYLVFCLLAFRIVWGLIGGRWSRFANFIYAPATLLRYLRGEHRPGDHFEVGHNPLGAGSVFALIGFLALQVGTGLFADDEIATVGPLNRFVSTDTGLAATAWHKNWGQWILIALIVLHIAAVVFYLVRKRTNLIRPMLEGDKQLPADTPASRDDTRSRTTALVLFAACAAVVTFVVTRGA